MEDFESLSEKLARVTNECELFREENSRLRELLKNQQTPRTEGPLPDSKPGPATSDQIAAADCGATKAAVAVPAQAAPELSTAGKRPINPSFTFARGAGYWGHERNRQFKQSHRAQRILA
jgi:hypothetical protein